VQLVMAELRSRSALIAGISRRRDSEVTPKRRGEPFFRAISVYPAATVQNLMIRPGTRTLCTRVNRPLVAFGNFISRAWDAVEQHLRRTGQPNPSSGYTSAAAKKLPRGFCPALP
jgi:hypothetical protein